MQLESKMYQINFTFIFKIVLATFLSIFTHKCCFAQLVVKTDLNCDFNILLYCDNNCSTSRILVQGDTVVMFTPQYPYDSIQSNCLCKDVSLIVIESSNSEQMLIIYMDEYENFIKNGGDITNYNSSGNKYIFCCRQESYSNQYQKVDGFCGTVVVNREKCTLEVLRITDKRKR